MEDHFHLSLISSSVIATHYTLCENVCLSQPNAINNIAMIYKRLKQKFSLFYF